MLELKNISKTYVAGDTKVEALKDVSINFRPNEFVSILGPSGCGKTTLLNIIGGLDKYTTGDLVINGVSTKMYKDKEWDAYRNHTIGFVFQSYNLISHLSVLSNVELALSLSGTNKSERKAKAIKALERVGLKDQIKKMPNQLSGGQMQRVAIARAIVNDPKIILADEPTGALDSETSVQVLELLKEIASDKLVIMVTHNESLAQKYSTRIISFLDGRVTNDTKPYDGKKLKTAKAKEVKVEEQKTTTKQGKIKKEKKPRSAMSIFTAFGLSLKNMFTKKTKTALVSFAGSIGIIGIALVLAVSNGLNKYIEDMQRDALGNYPISIATASLDLNSMTDFLTSYDRNSNKDKDQVGVYNSMELMMGLGHFNYLGSEFREFLTQYYNEDQKKSESQRDIASMQMVYNTNMIILAKMSNAEIKRVSGSTSISTISGETSNPFFEGFADPNMLLKNYDKIAGEYPSDKSEIALIVDESNSFDQSWLKQYGLDRYIDLSDPTNLTLDLERVIANHEFKLIKYDDFYIKTTGQDEKVTFDKLQESQYSTVYDNGITLKISGVFRPKKDAKMLYNQGFMYLPSLTQWQLEQAEASEIVKQTKEDKIFYEPFVLNISELNMFAATIDPNMFTFTLPSEMVEKVKMLNMTLSEDQCMELGLQSLGVSQIPTAISIYTQSFDAKERLLNAIEDFNSTSSYKIKVSDSASFLTSTLGKLIDIISYVLIAFTAVSLIVSSIMIGVITYTSVIERTKEIGVLRSIGARKRDISRVFNAETTILGLLSGVIGVVVSYLLTVPINLILKAVAGINNLAILNPLHALLLVVISMALTLIAGLIPARIASKKDPVVALRTE